MKGASAAMSRSKQLAALASKLAVTEDNERRALARDLHDDLGQMMPIIKIKLTALYKSQDPARIHAGLKEIEKLVDAANNSVRSLALQLSPPVLRSHGLTAALEWLAGEMERSYGLRVELHDDGSEKKLDERQGIILFRAVRELLVNVAKHAGVDQAVLRTHFDGQKLRLVVSDAGAGFDHMQLRPRAQAPRLGLAAVRERMGLIGGKLHIDSHPGEGTTISLSAPLQPTLA